MSTRRTSRNPGGLDCVSHHLRLVAASALALVALLLTNGTAQAAQVVEGRIGPGSLYALFVPEAWNGDLVLYMHGIVDAGEPIALPTADQAEPLRDRLLDEGYAVAYSSYSENGWAVKDGAQRTQQLRGLFLSKFGKPRRTYLAGHSMGALVAVMLAERHPQHYDGVFAMCGIVGGFQAELDYIAHLRALFDVFYPGVLPGNVLDIPPDLDLWVDVIMPVVAAISADPSGAVAISMIDQTPVDWFEPEELVESFVQGLGFHVRGFENVLGRTHGHSPFDNWDTVYSGPLPLPVLRAINAAVGRFVATPDARNYVQRYYEPTGILEIPVLTLHNVRDPVAPLFNEARYREIVAAAGHGDLLVQRTVGRYGHCEFEVEEMVEAFLELVSWVEDGVTPVP